MGKSFWHEFMMQLLDELGVDYKKYPVTKIIINLIPGDLPDIAVHMEAFMEKEVVPLVKHFTAAQWKEVKEGS